MTRHHPPEPWHLRGDMYTALWLVPGRDLPTWPLPEGARAVSVSGRRLLVTFWVDYTGGDLAYRELLVAVVVRHGVRLAATAVQVWVDDERSLSGGRRLWALPKEPAVFTFTPLPPARHHLAGLHATVTVSGPAGGVDSASGPARQEPHASSSGPARQEPHASVVSRDLLRLPLRVPVRAHLSQPRGDGTDCRVPLRLAGRPSVSRLRMRVRRDGPLAYLAGRRPVAAASLRDFRFTVGSR
ncbi:acetoacetate decarboxylase family protein [Streptomyces sp. NPDC003487]